MSKFNLHDVVQFNEKATWCGCLGIVEEVKKLKNDIKYMVGVPQPLSGTAYIYVNEKEDVLEYIGLAKLIVGGEEC